MILMLPHARTEAARRAVTLCVVGLAAYEASADCSLTNIDKRQLPEWSCRPYQGFPTGMYPNYANSRPPAHLVATLAIATNEIVPLDSSGNVNTNTGKIVLISVGMSNTTQEIASGDRVTNNRTNAFKYRADVISMTVSNGVFLLRLPHFKAATETMLAADELSDLSAWNPAPVSQTIDEGPIETVVVAETVADGLKYYRLRAMR